MCYAIERHTVRIIKGDRCNAASEAKRYEISCFKLFFKEIGNFHHNMH